MTNKEVAHSFLKSASSGDVKAAYDKYVAPNFRHHNLYFKGDRQSLMDAMEQAHQMSPNKHFEVKKTVEEGDFVVTHSLVKRSAPGALDIVVFHMFRFQNHQIVELWDLGQEIQKDSPNENGAF